MRKREIIVSLKQFCRQNQEFVEINRFDEKKPPDKYERYPNEQRKKRRL